LKAIDSDWVSTGMGMGIGSGGRAETGEGLGGGGGVSEYVDDVSGVVGVGVGSRGVDVVVGDDGEGGEGGGSVDNM
jgi:hypothetical protein